MAAEPSERARAMADTLRAAMSDAPQEPVAPEPQQPEQDPEVVRREGQKAMVAVLARARREGLRRGDALRPLTPPARAEKPGRTKNTAREEQRRRRQIERGILKVAPQEPRPSPGRRPGADSSRGAPPIIHPAKEQEEP